MTRESTGLVAEKSEISLQASSLNDLLSPLGNKRHYYMLISLLHIHLRFHYQPGYNPLEPVLWISDCDNSWDWMMLLMNYSY